MLDSDEEYEASVMEGGAEELRNALIGRRIVAVTKGANPESGYGKSGRVTFTLDDGSTAHLDDTDDCCAFTCVDDLKFLEGVENAITSVETTDNYEKWFIYAGGIPVVEMDASWSPGNPYYYGFGFYVTVEKEGQ